jgi:hypothetical protein
MTFHIFVSTVCLIEYARVFVEYLYRGTLVSLIKFIIGPGTSDDEVGVGIKSGLGQINVDVVG